MKRERQLLAARGTGAVLLVLALAAASLGCGQSNAEAPGGGPRGGPGARGGGGFPPGGSSPGFGDSSGGNAIPVKVTAVVRRQIADYLETNGSLEAENEVDIVTRTTGPIVELNVEEGDFVRAGQVLARIDAAEIEAQLGIARVNLAEADLAWKRAQGSYREEVISQEAFDLAKSNYDGAAAQIVGTEILLNYTVIRAPFDGLIIERVIKNAEHVGANARLFRISDFDPLLCPIQLPEKDLTRLKLGQPAYLTVEAFTDVRFPARVLRISPVVYAATGTVKVTLEVQGEGRLRPGMFASVFVETDVHDNAVVAPKQALVLESTADTVYVVVDDGEGGKIAQRRELELGFEESDHMEVLSGVAEGEDVVTKGQDTLSDRTPVLILEREGPAPAPTMFTSQPDAGASPAQLADRQAGAPADGAAGAQPTQRGPTPERIKMMRSRMKERGMTDEQIDQAIERMKSGQAPPRRPPA